MIEILLSYSKHLKYNKDSLIFSAGSRPTEFYYIIRGKISLKTTFNATHTPEKDGDAYIITNKKAAEYTFKLLKQDRE